MPVPNTVSRTLPDSGRPRTVADPAGSCDRTRSRVESALDRLEQRPGHQRREIPRQTTERAPPRASSDVFREKSSGRSDGCDTPRRDAHWLGPRPRTTSLRRPLRKLAEVALPVDTDPDILSQDIAGWGVCTGDTTRCRLSRTGPALGDPYLLRRRETRSPRRGGTTLGTLSPRHHGRRGPGADDARGHRPPT